jgi:hypothetical protein
VSFALALRNPEGVLIAADKLCTQYLESGPVYVSQSKLRWFRRARAACFIMPTTSPSESLAAAPDLANDGSQLDFRAAAVRVYQQNVSYLEQLRTEYPNQGHPSFTSPHLVAAAYSENGPFIMRITPDGSEDDPRGPLAIFTAGAWNELHDGSARLSAIPWRTAMNMKNATRLVRDVMLGYIADYEATQAVEDEVSGYGRVVGGPIEVAIITKNRIKVETYGMGGHS